MLRAATRAFQAQRRVLSRLHVLAPRVPSPPETALVIHRRAFHPGIPLLLKIGPALKIFKITTTWASLVVQRFRNAKVHGGSDETLGHWWRRWMRNVTLVGTGALAATGAYAYANQIETVALSGRRRLLLTTREEEIVVGNEASEGMRRKMKGAIFCELPLTTDRGDELAPLPTPLSWWDRKWIDFKWWLCRRAASFFDLFLGLRKELPYKVRPERVSPDEEIPGVRFESSRWRVETSAV